MLKRHAPALYKGLSILSDIKDNYRFNKNLQRLYERLKSESFDCAVLEKSGNIRVIPSDFGWSDVGSFNSISRLVDKDKDGNAIFGNHVSIDTKGSIIFSDTNHLVGTIGIKDLILVVSSDAILVCDKNRAEDIKKLVGRIKKKKSLLKFL
jgi:mannose-1-phosphate guanylyltransferase